VAQSSGVAHRRLQYSERLMVESIDVAHRGLQYSDLDPSFFSVASAAHRRLQYSDLQAIDCGIHIERGL
jgi:hypothetical protein